MEYLAVAHSFSEQQLRVKCAQTDSKSLNGSDLCWVIVHDIGV